MPEHTQARRSSSKTEPEQDAAPQDQRNPELDADVACCLAEIDALLEEAETERDRAVREFSELKGREDAGENVDAELRVWQAAYAHLQLSIGRSCCVLYLWDDAANERIK